MLRANDRSRMFIQVLGAEEKDWVRLIKIESSLSIFIPLGQTLVSYHNTGLTQYSQLPEKELCWGSWEEEPPGLEFRQELLRYHY